jgi:hypothetical protein
MPLLRNPYNELPVTVLTGYDPKNNPVSSIPDNIILLFVLNMGVFLVKMSARAIPIIKAR